MSYNYYMEFGKNKPATHPQTGETMPRTIIDIYVYDDHIDIMGYGTLDTIRPDGGVTDERINQVKEVMVAQGFRILNEEAGRTARPQRRTAAVCR